MRPIHGVSNSEAAPSEAYLAPVLDYLLMRGNSLDVLTPKENPSGRWASGTSARWAKLKEPIDFGALLQEFTIPEYVCADFKHDCIVHMEAREYILGPGYTSWEATGESYGGRIKLSPYPPPEGPYYLNLDPVARWLIGSEAGRRWGFWRQKHELGWKLSHEGYVLKLDRPVDFELLKRTFDFPESIVVSPQHGSLTDRYTWASIHGST